MLHMKDLPLALLFELGSGLQPAKKLLQFFFGDSKFILGGPHWTPNHKKDEKILAVTKVIHFLDGYG